MNEVKEQATQTPGFQRGGTAAALCRSLEKHKHEEGRGEGLGTPEGMHAQCADAQQSLEAQPQTCTNPVSAVETSLAAVRTVHFGRWGPEVKDSPFLSPGQACWCLSSAGGYGLGYVL